MSKVEADHHLLFGVLALQTGLIKQEALFTAFNAWTRGKSQSMAEILVNNEALDAPRRALVEGLVAAHLEVHGGDVEKSLAAIEAGPSTRERLARLEDPDLNNSITRVGESLDPWDSPGDRTQPTKGSRSSRQEQLLADQRDCWKRGDRVLVETYVDRHPDLRDNPEALLDLIYHEVVLREQIGEEPTAEEYIGRFPALTDAIREQFEIHCMFTHERSESESGDRDQPASYSVGTASSGGLRFRVLRPHAKGGLGAVFVALDSELHREVALKQILDRHADDPVSRSRFIVEAEITGGLEHPGIVPVYGLGNYANGRPFYAMRFIQGDSLKAALATFHADASLKSDPGRRSLELRKLLRRFVDVCNAIEYAHSRGVLHRDIKPGNIIVGKHGETLVVDWGLAKSVGRFKPDEKSKDVTLIPTSLSGMVETLEGSALGTPAFMSPEQAAGELDRLGPQSDVYSLGATLFMILTGRPAFEGNDLGALLQAVRNGRFSPPTKLDPSLDRALEAICLKAMALSPQDRYSSPRSLAEDIERWTADEPVSARPEPLSERARRWTRHHRTLATTAAALLLFGVVGLSAFAAVVSDKNRKLVTANTATKKAETLADARLDRAMASIEDYFTGFSEDALKGGQLPPSLRDRLLAKPRQFYEQLAAELSAKPNPSDRERFLLGHGRSNLGRILRILGRNTEARVQDEAALAIYETLVARHPEIPEYQSGLAVSQVNFGILLATTGRADEAFALNKSAITIFEELASQHPDISAYNISLTNAHANLGMALFAAGRSDEAAAAYKNAVTIGEALVARQSNVLEHQNELAASHANLGMALSAAGRSDEAATACKNAITIYETLIARQPDIPEYQSGLASGHIGFGIILAGAGRAGEAAAAHEKAITILEPLVIRQPDIPDYQHRLASSHSHLGFTFASTGRAVEAAAAYKKAIAIFEPLVARQPDIPVYQSELAKSHFNLGSALAGVGRADEAAAAYKKAITIYEPLITRQPDVAEYRSRLANSHYNLGITLAAAGLLDEAAAAYKNAITIFEALVARYPAVSDYRDWLARSHLNLGALRKTQGSFVDALAAFRRAAKFVQPGTLWAVNLPALIRETVITLVLTQRLPAVLKGEDKPKNPGERLVFAQLCYDLSHYAAAARLWAEAIEADPKLADSREATLRCNAACAAALAATAKGQDDPPPNEEAKGRLRAQARDWLKAELAAWTKVLETGQTQPSSKVAATMQRWKQGSDLAGIRDPDALEKLPEAERTEWRDLWAEVDSLLEKARRQKP